MSPRPPRRMNLDPERVQKVRAAFYEVGTCEAATKRAEIVLVDALRDALLPILSEALWTRQGTNELRMDRVAVEELREALGLRDLYYCEVCLNPEAEGEAVTLSLMAQGVTLSSLPGPLAQFVTARNLVVDPTEWTALQAAEAQVATARAALHAAEERLQRARNTLLSRMQRSR